MSADSHFTEGQADGVRVVGSSWQPTPRPCSVCGDEHRHLTDLSDGRHVCIGCCFDVYAGRAKAAL